MGVGEKGIPIRVELGPRDIAANTVFMARRDRHAGQKESMDRETFIASITDILDQIQQFLFDRALAYQKANTFHIDSWQEFESIYKDARGYQNGAFVFAHWCGSGDCEERIKKSCP